MKKVLMALIALSVWWKGATSLVDYTCVSDCMKQGYQWGYCQRICSY